MKNQVITTLIPQLLANGAKFISFEYENQAGEQATHVLQVGVSYKNALEKDFQDIDSLEYEETDLYDKETFDIAKLEVKKSIAMAIGKEEQTQSFKNASNGQKDAYISLGEGISIHKESGALNAFSMRHSKFVHKAGEYKKVNSRPKTIAKRKIESKLRKSKFKRFTLKEVATAKMSGQTIDLS